MGDGRHPSTMDYFHGTQYPWLSIILPELTRKSVSWEVLDWRDTLVQWERKSMIVLGPVWGYFEDHQRFALWVDLLRLSDVPLYNSAEFILWNLNKHYLEELDRAGILVPRSLFVNSYDMRPWDRLVNDFLSQNMQDEFIIKGLVDAAGSTFFKVHRTQIKECESHFNHIKHNYHGVILQEYLPEVASSGEFSFVFFDGQFGHSFLKIPTAGEDRVQSFFGGRSFHFGAESEESVLARIRSDFRPDLQLSSSQIKLAHRHALRYILILRQLLHMRGIPFPMYVRLDGTMRGENLLLMELEGVEPYMEIAEALKANPSSLTLKYYVDAIIKSLQKAEAPSLPLSTKLACGRDCI